jgi:hypothetical protein
MTMFEPKSDTKQVHIWADNDKAGIDAAKKLQEKLLAAGKVKVQVVIPKKQGHDFLDELNTIVFKVKLENVYYETEETTFKSKEAANKFLKESEKNDFYVKAELLKIKQNPVQLSNIRMNLKTPAKLR